MSRQLGGKPIVVKLAEAHLLNVINAITLSLAYLLYKGREIGFSRNLSHQSRGTCNGQGTTLIGMPRLEIKVVSRKLLKVEIGCDVICRHTYVHR